MTERRCVKSPQLMSPRGFAATVSRSGATLHAGSRAHSGYFVRFKFADCFAKIRVKRDKSEGKKKKKAVGGGFIFPPSDLWLIETSEKWFLKHLLILYA